MNEYIVSLVTTSGNVKTKVVEAVDCKDAEAVVSAKYPSYEIIRITRQSLEIDYFNTVKAMKKNG